MKRIKKKIPTTNITPDIYLGVDPGASGALVGIVPALELQFCATFKELTERDIYDAFAILPRQHVETTMSNPRIVAVLEQVNAMPKQGVTSMFKFGRHFGMLEMALVACKIKYRLERPARWQQVLGCRTKGDKTITKKKAQQLYPNTPFRITHANADALLLAEYARTLKW